MSEKKQEKIYTFTDELDEKNTVDQEEVITDIDADIDMELEQTEYEGVSQNDKLKKLREELKQAKAQSQEYLTGWQTERASFANYKSEEEKKRKERIAGLKLNLRKAEIFPLGSLRPSNYTLFNLKWEKEKIYALGTWIYKDYDLGPRHTLNEKLEAIRQLLSTWSRRRLTWLGKITVL